MIVTFPHMGNVYISISAMLCELDIQYVLPPFNNKQALDLGVRYTPEDACLPLKLTVGNLIQAHSLGADTVIMLGSKGPCRFGYYCEMQREILEDAGCPMEFIVFDSALHGLPQIADRIKKISGAIHPVRLLNVIKSTTEIIIAMDKLEGALYEIKSRELKKGSSDAIYNDFKKRALTTKGIANTKGLISETQKRLRANSIRPDAEPLRIGIVGEIYGAIDAFTSMHLQSRLAAMEVESTRLVTLRLWVVDHMIKKALRLPVDKRYARAAKPYLPQDIGGHTRETLGHTVLHALDGYDGIIQLYPLGCMPEIVAQSILPAISDDYNIPILTLITDEMTGEAGFMTRIEAFLDLLYQRRSRSKRGRSNQALHSSVSLLHNGGGIL